MVYPICLTHDLVASLCVVFFFFKFIWMGLFRLSIYFINLVMICVTVQLIMLVFQKYASLVK